MTSSNCLQKTAIVTEISILLFVQLKGVDETSVFCLYLFWSPLVVLYKMFLNITRPCLNCGKQLGLMNRRCKAFRPRPNQMTDSWKGTEIINYKRSTVCTLWVQMSTDWSRAVKLPINAIYMIPSFIFIGCTMNQHLWWN